MKIAVIGTGYVGLSIATLLSQHHDVVAMDVVAAKVEAINRRICPIQDSEIERYFASKSLHLHATCDIEEACRDAKFVVIAVPTNYDPIKNYFDTHHIEESIDRIYEINRDATIVIKSTVPVGYCEALHAKHRAMGRDINLLFSPEFLRESSAFYDNLHPSRIIVGYPTVRPELRAHAEEFARVLQEGAAEEVIPTLYMTTTEAEAVKLFANTYLALRVSYFNELDTYAEMKGLDSQAIIEGVGLDPRIGTHPR